MRSLKRNILSASVDALDLLFRRRARRAFELYRLLVSMEALTIAYIVFTSSLLGFQIVFALLVLGPSSFGQIKVDVREHGATGDVVLPEKSNEAQRPECGSLRGKL